jgi:hypothetical protein
MGFGQKSIQAPATNHLAKRHVAGACGGTGDSDCVARTLTNYTSTYLENWLITNANNASSNNNTVDYTITNVGATYSVSTSTLTVNFNYTITNINGNICYNNTCPSYPVYYGMQFNLVITDGSNNTYSPNFVPLLGNGSSVTLGVAYSVPSPNSITIPNVTQSNVNAGSWTITADNNDAPIYNSIINAYSSIVINSAYSGAPVTIPITTVT